MAEIKNWVSYDDMMKAREEKKKKGTKAPKDGKKTGKKK